MELVGKILTGGAIMGLIFVGFWLHDLDEERRRRERSKRRERPPPKGFSVILKRGDE